MVQSIFLKICSGLLVIFLMGAEAAQAATTEVVLSAGRWGAYETVYGIRDDTATRGVDLDGAMLTATYSDGSSEEIVWRANRDNQWDSTGAADGGFTDLYLNWESFEMRTTSLLTSLLFNVAPASTVFDVPDTLDDDPLGGSTPGSSFGFPFEFYGESEELLGNVIATYSGIVNLAGRAADGDLYTTMLVDFSGLSTGGIFGDVNWVSDMDTLMYAGDLTPVPLPASLPLLLAGLGALIVSGRRARR